MCDSKKIGYSILKKNVKMKNQKTGISVFSWKKCHPVHSEQAYLSHELKKYQKMDWKRLT